MFPSFRFVKVCDACVAAVTKFRTSEVFSRCFASLHRQDDEINRLPNDIRIDSLCKSERTIKKSFNSLYKCYIES